MKLDHRVLIGNGNDLTHSIKRRVEDIKNTLSQNDEVKKFKLDKVNLESIIVDSYDNDELLLLAFADSIRLLDIYLKEIRRITCSDLKDIQWAGEGIKHVCASCHMSYGYHIDFSFSKPSDVFMPWNHKMDDDFFVNCLIETKPGHRNEFCNCLEQIKKERFGLDELKLNKTVTGGSIVHLQIPIATVENLHSMTCTNEGLFHDHVRRIKLTLNDGQITTKNQEKNTSHYCCGQGEKNLIGVDKIRLIREKLTRLGVSKIVRERLMALLDLYNDCGRNKLQSYYFEQMADVVLNIDKVLSDFEKDENESLLKIENELTEEINAFETAFYNRMNNKMTPNAVLEYGGGIQQFLQAFGYAYREIVRIISPLEASKQYSLITGVSKESSIRTHTELNINHIIYPQLFSITTWKEASNFSVHILDDYKYNASDAERISPLVASFNAFKKIIENQKVFEQAANGLLDMTEMSKSDPVFLTLDSLMTRETLKYTFHDYIVYHFAFQRDFSLMWRYYFKIFLQTTSVYSRRGIVKKKAFVFMLLRLFVVGLREEDVLRRGMIDEFLKEQTKSPFDPLLVKLWIECFDKVYAAAKSIILRLQTFNFIEVSEELLIHIEYEMMMPKGEKQKYLAKYLFGCMRKKEGNGRIGMLNAILEARSINIDILCKAICNYSLDYTKFASKNIFSPDNVVCLLSSFIICIDQLDREGKSKEVLKSVPRNFDGGIDDIVFREMISSASNILSDTTGGFMIPDHEVRKRYFAYRTVLYRTLWDLSYRTGQLCEDINCN